MSQIIRNRTMRLDAIGIPVVAGVDAGLSALASERGGQGERPKPSRESLVHFEDVAVAALSERFGQQSTVQQADPKSGPRLEDERERAYKLGMEQGRQAGTAAAQSEYESQLHRVAALLASCQTEVNACLDRLDDDLIELVFVAVTRILGAAAVRREGVLAMIQNVLQEQKEKRTPMVVRLSVRDWEMLGEESRKLLVGGKAISLVVDEKVEVGGCLIEMDRGTLDGRLETQLAKLKQTLVDCHADRQR